jgi:hypothetical protein
VPPCWRGASDRRWWGDRARPTVDRVRGQDDEEAAWQAIVDNYGERVLDDDPERPDGLEPERPDEPAAGRPDEPGSAATEPRVRPSPPPEPPEDRYVPPTPPPLPRPRGPRGAAWVGLLGSPSVLLLSVLVGWTPPRLLAWSLVVAFVAGFVYLVLQMPRGPRDPWDDGAQV